MDRNNKFYIEYTDLLSTKSYDKIIDEINILLMQYSKLKQEEYIIYLKKYYILSKERNYRDLISIIKSLDFSRDINDISFYHILLDSSTNLKERIKIKQREKTVLAFLSNDNSEWFEYGYNPNILNELTRKSSFIISLMQSNKMEKIVQNSISKHSLNDKNFDLNNYIQAFKEIKNYNGPAIEYFFKKNYHETISHLPSVQEFLNKMKKHIENQAFTEDLLLSFENTLIINKNHLERVYDKNLFNIQEVVDIKNNIENKYFIDYINGLEFNQFQNHKTDFTIDSKLKNKSSISSGNFTKGGGRAEKYKFFHRDNIIYTELEASGNKNFTHQLIKHCTKRNSYIEYYKKTYFESYTAVDSLIKVNHIKFQKLQQKINNTDVTNLNYYEYVMVEPSLNYMDEINYNKTPVLLKLDMNLPRHELEYFINEFLNEHHQTSLKIPKNEKTRALKIKKIIDILFIYDGKMLNISNDNIIDEFQKCDEDYKKNPLIAKRMSNATFQKYLNIGIELIDKKGYLEIAKGNKSVFDII